MSEFIKLEKVSLSYNGSTELQDMAIHEVDMSIQQGSFTAVVGPSGCGKSTMMKLLSGLQAPTLGYVFLDNREVNGPVSGVGMAFQKSTLLPCETLSTMCCCRLKSARIMNTVIDAESRSTLTKP